ncbi:MAG: hypothetical protein KAR79_00475 [Simkaniaceae bacterium]|nr:hypothetical protein [Simkaniaceae bacterium]
MSTESMSIQTACNNFEQIYFGKHHVLTSDSEGQISYIYSFNLLGRIIRCIKNLFSGSEDERLQLAALETLRTIRQNQVDHPERDSSIVIHHGLCCGTSHIGFDKIALQITSDEYNFPIGPYPHQDRPNSPLIELREIAMQVLTFANAHRVERNIPFFSDDINF